MNLFEKFDLSKQKSGFFSYQSNKLENLALQAIEIFNFLEESRPFFKKRFVFQTPEIGRWFALKIAEKNGICANMEVVSPEEFLKYFAETFFDMKSGSIFDKKTLEWVLYRLFNSDFINREKSLAVVKNYIDGDPVKSFLLSKITADIFEQYFFYRLDLIEKWKRGELKYENDEDERRQFLIFREIYSREEGIDKHEFYRRFQDKCLNFQGNFDDVPSDITLFGFSFMSDYHLELFKSLSKLTRVHLFYLNPSRESWLDGEKRDESDDLNAFSNRLLDSWGRVGRDFIEKVSEFGFAADLFDDLQGKKSLLSTIQREILRDAESGEKIFDDSIKINACWGKMREIEVLKDSLLELFDKNPSLRLRDIAVMSPKIEDYAQFIEAVFGNDESENFIPWSIADREIKSESKIVSTFLQILRIDKTNFKKSEIFALFEKFHVHTKFNVEESSLDKIKELLDESGIKWGIDKNARKSDGYPEYEQNSWQFGLDRILLAYAMPQSDDFDFFNDVLPIKNFEGEESKIFAGFISFIKELFRLSISFKTPKTLDKWIDELQQIVKFFFFRDESSLKEIKLLQTFLQSLKVFESTLGDEELPLSVVYSYLDDYFSFPNAGGGFFTGQVTFCSLKPLRSIPFKAICLIGMNDSLFPREQLAQPFNLIEKYPRAGDRSLKNNDRYLFLETLLSADENLIISYNARSLTEPEENFPAVPVETLKDYLALKYPNGQNDVEKLYPLQPFSSRYFDGSGRFVTYSRQDFSAALSFRAGREKLGERTSLPKQFEDEIKLNDLVDFFINPVKHFFKKRVKADLPYLKSNENEDDDFFVYDDNLTIYALKDDLLKFLETKNFVFNDESREQFYKIKRGKGEIPVNFQSESMLKKEAAKTEPLVNKIVEVAKGKAAAKREIELDLKIVLKGDRPIKNVRLVGSVEFYDEYLLLYRAGNDVRTKDKLRLLINHLALNAAGEEKRSRFLSVKQDFSLRPLPKEDARRKLSSLISIYFDGFTNIPFCMPGNPDIITAASKDDFTSKFKESLDSDSNFNRPDVYFDFALQLENFSDESLEEIKSVSQKILNILEDCVERKSKNLLKSNEFE